MLDAHVREARAKFRGVWTFQWLSAKKTNFRAVRKFTVHALF